MNSKPRTYRRWLLLLVAGVQFGCVALPQQQGAWPWEHAIGKDSEPATGDYFAIRVGVANFGTPPAAVAPARPESPPRQELPEPPAATSRAIPDDSSPPSPSPSTSAPARDCAFSLRGERSSLASRQLLEMSGSSTSIVAVNSCDAPVSVIVSVDGQESQNAVTDKRVPYLTVVPARSTSPLILVSAKSKDSPYSYHYSYTWSVGDYTARHNCPELYRIPFADNVQARAIATTDDNAPPAMRNAIGFVVPHNTQVLAARKGIVVRIAPDLSLDILHDDTTIGTYQGLSSIADGITVGAAVTTDSVLGTVSRQGNRPDAYLQVSTWRPEPEADESLRMTARHGRLETVSFPLPFGRSATDKRIVITGSQMVSRGNLAPAGKPVKGKSAQRDSRAKRDGSRRNNL